MTSIHSPSSHSYKKNSIRISQLEHANCKKIKTLKFHPTQKAAKTEMRKQDYFLLSSAHPYIFRANIQCDRHQTVIGTHENIFDNGLWNKNVKYFDTL